MSIYNKRIPNKNRRYYFWVQLLTVTLVIWTAVVACESPAGEDGPQGPEGPFGPAGDDGSMMYSGAGEPREVIGDIGDYYLNQDTGELHGPKSADGWDDPIIVLMGDNGKDGTQIYDGDGVPDDTLGVIGDFYIDITNQDLYGPKTGSGWGDVSKLNGEDGQDGSQIHAGDGPPDISVGVVGDYYLDQTNKDLYGPKTDSGWGSPIDLNGEDGQDGADGSNGSKIHSGSGAPNATIGVTGDYYLDKSNYDLYGPKTSPNKVDNGWGSPLNLKGADGNANVTRYKFSGHDFSVEDYVSLDLTDVIIGDPEESVWLVYVKVALGTSYDMPGYGTRGDTYYRTYRIGSIITIAVVDGPGESYSETEVVRIEVSNTEDLTKQVGEITIIPDHLDISDYKAVAEYYGFYRE
jgi:hypothetical protein